MRRVNNGNTGLKQNQMYKLEGGLAAEHFNNSKQVSGEMIKEYFNKERARIARLEENIYTELNCINAEMKSLTRPDADNNNGNTIQTLINQLEVQLEIAVNEFESKKTLKLDCLNKRMDVLVTRNDKVGVVQVCYDIEQLRVATRDVTIVKIQSDIKHYASLLGNDELYRELEDKQARMTILLERKESLQNDLNSLKRAN